MLLRPVPSARRSGNAFVVLGAALLAATAVLIAVSGRWSLSPMLVLGSFHVVRGLLLRRAKVVVDQEGLLVNTGGLRDRFTAWHEVAELRIDPPGGPRLVRVRLRDGREVQLPELSEQGRALLLDARPR